MHFVGNVTLHPSIKFQPAIKDQRQFERQFLALDLQTPALWSNTQDSPGVDGCRDIYHPRETKGTSGQFETAEYQSYLVRSLECSDVSASAIRLYKYSLQVRVFSAMLLVCAACIAPTAYSHLLHALHLLHVCAAMDRCNEQI